MWIIKASYVSYLKLFTLINKLINDKMNDPFIISNK